MFDQVQMTPNLIVIQITTFFLLLKVRCSNFHNQQVELAVFIVSERKNQKFVLCLGKCHET